MGGARRPPNRGLAPAWECGRAVGPAADGGGRRAGRGEPATPCLPGTQGPRDTAETQAAVVGSSPAPGRTRRSRPRREQEPRRVPRPEVGSAAPSGATSGPPPEAGSAGAAAVAPVPSLVLCRQPRLLVLVSGRGEWLRPRARQLWVAPVPCASGYLTPAPAPGAGGRAGRGLWDLSGLGVGGGRGRRPWPRPA